MKIHFFSFLIVKILIPPNEYFPYHIKLLVLEFFQI